MRVILQGLLPGIFAGLLCTNLGLAGNPAEVVGDWRGKTCVSQVTATTNGEFRANLLKQFDLPDQFIATLHGRAVGEALNFSGEGWKAALAEGKFKGSKGDETFELQRLIRHSPTENAKPPPGAVVLFDGRNLDSWTRQKERQWLEPDGPAPWKLINGVMEAVPGQRSIITTRQFGDCDLHVEFLTLGPVNSGVFLQARYEVGINESYGRLEGPPCGALDNCTAVETRTRVRASFPPGQWQTFDISFRAPRFDSSSKKTANARATVRLNGVKIYDERALDPPHGAAKRLGEAATGPIMLQEHGEPIQFRNIWLVERSR